MGRQQKIKKARKQLRKPVSVHGFQDTELSKYFPEKLKQYSGEIALYAINEARPGMVMVEFGKDEVYPSFQSLESFRKDVQELEGDDCDFPSHWLEETRKHLRLIEETNFSTHRLLWLGIGELDEKIERFSLTQLQESSRRSELVEEVAT
jgi:hypothetical protein